MRHCLVRILVQMHNWVIFLRKLARRGRYTNGDRYREMLNEFFFSQKMKRSTLATFGFNRTALRAIQPKLHSMFCDLFLKIALSATALMSFGHLGAAV